eukprot:11583923-Alexandrium_andersonii.AAC.1
MGLGPTTNRSSRRSSQCLRAMTRRPSTTRSIARSSCATCRCRCASAWPLGAAAGARAVGRCSSCWRRRP